jgi:hypothetical protein
MAEVKITVKYDEQSKTVTGSSSIELITTTESFLNDEKKIEDVVLARADKLFDKVFENARDLTMRYKR